MAKGKKKQIETRPDTVEKPVKSSNHPSILEYFLQLVVFTVFCLISAGLIRLVTGYTLGLSFFFGVLILGFFVVCVFSYLHDRLYRDEEEAEGSP